MNLRSLLSTALKLAAIAAALTVRAATGAHGQAAEPPAAESTAHAAPAAEAESEKAIHGVSLGDYRIRSYYLVDAQKGTVRFSLFATVKDEHFGEMQRLVEEHQQKLRDQVIMATRLAPLAVFQEPDLATFRRRLLVRLRRAIPDLAIEDLCVSEFDLVIKSL
jgi:hypothetical protein